MTRKPIISKDETSIIIMNRQHTIDILNVIQAVDLSRNKIPTEPDPGFPGRMARTRDLFVQILKSEQTTVFYDLSAIDSDLLFAAESWKAAVQEGFYGKALWSINALFNGITALRTNVPMDKAASADQILRERNKQSALYTQLIQHAEAIDIAIRNILREEAEMKKNLEAVSPIRDLILSVRGDPATVPMVSNIIACQLGRISPAELSPEETDLRDKVNSGATLHKAIRANRSAIEMNEEDLSRARQLFDDTWAKLPLEGRKQHGESFAAFNSYQDISLGRIHDIRAGMEHIDLSMEDPCPPPVTPPTIRWPDTL